MLAVFAAQLAVVLVRYRGEPVRPPGEGGFSAEPALVLLDELVGDGVPHPVGSAAAARVRERIVARLEALGYEPQVQESLVLGYLRFATVRNVLARLRGTGEADGAVLVVCHYDSVRAGPGASDDAMGVVVALELARLLREAPPLPRDVVFLFDEGEEDGLFGASAFVDGHPWAADVFAVVNLEARGTSGASMMFETSGDDAWIAPLFAGALPRPIGSSVADYVYERMPNDTDLSVFERRGFAGVNFAYVGGVHDYHTAGDSVASTSPLSVQHTGDNALAMVPALARAEPPEPDGGHAVWFDVLGLFALWWPVGWSVPLALAAALLLALCGRGLMRRGHVTRGAIGAGLLKVALLGAFVVAAAWIVHVGLGPSGGVTNPWPALAALAWSAHVAGGLAAAIWVAAAWQESVGTWGHWLGAWSAWTLLALAAAFALPGVGYVFLLPALAAALAGLAHLALERGEPRHPGLLALLVPAGVAAALLLPLAYGVHLALGLASPYVPAAFVALLASTALPTVAPGVGRGMLRGFFVLLMIAFVACWRMRSVPAFTPESPQRVNLVCSVDADTGASRVQVHTSGPLPPALAALAAFDDAPAQTWPLWGRPEPPTELAPAPESELAAPVCEVLERSVSADARRVRVRLSSPRGALLVALAFDEPDRGLRWSVGGDPSTVIHPRAPGIVSLTTPPQGVELVLEVAGDAPLAARVLDRTPGLLPSAAALAAARDGAARAYGPGDATIVGRRVEL